MKKKTENGLEKLKRAVHGTRGKDTEKGRRSQSENVEETAEGRRRKKENYGGLLLCKHRSSFHLAAICSLREADL